MCGIAGFFSKELDGIDRNKKEIRSVWQIPWFGVI